MELYNTTNKRQRQISTKFSFQIYGLNGRNIFGIDFGEHCKKGEKEEEDEEEEKFGEKGKKKILILKSFKYWNLHGPFSQFSMMWGGLCFGSLLYLILWKAYMNPI